MICYLEQQKDKKRKWAQELKNPDETRNWAQGLWKPDKELGPRAMEPDEIRKWAKGC